MNKTKTFIFIFVGIAVSLPFIQYFLPFFPNGRIVYGENNKPNIVFSLSQWHTGEFQEKKEPYLEQNMGLRNDLIRSRNEIDYRLFHKLNSYEGVLGKEDYIFDNGYLREYTGSDFVGEQTISEKIDKLTLVRDSLAKHNILLLVVFSPSKAHYYPEYLPKKWEKRGEKINFDYFTQACEQKNIPYIDFNRYFLLLKAKTPYPLFIKTGIHWTAYGAALAMDSLFKRLEQEKKVNMPDFDWHELEICDTTRGEDNDVWRLANLLSNFSTPHLAYPKLTFPSAKQGQKKLKILTIGDSFWFDILHSGAYDHLFEASELWYYCNNILPENSSHKITKYNIREELEKYDVVILESAGTNLSQWGWGFIENAYHYYTHPDNARKTSPFFQKRVTEITSDIKNNPEWLHNLIVGAEKEQISVDSMIYKNALFMALEELK